MNGTDRATSTASAGATRDASAMQRLPIADNVPSTIGDAPVDAPHAQLLAPARAPAFAEAGRSDPTLASMTFRRVAGSAGRWKKQLSAAKQYWQRLSVEDLIWSDGHQQRLAGLVQERYEVDHEEAERQVRRFLAEAGC